MRQLGLLVMLGLAVGLAQPYDARAQDGGVPAPTGLVGIRWQWLHYTARGVASLAPEHPERYWVEFLPEGRLALQADCNRGSGTWTQAGAEVKLKAMATTLAACLPGSLDSRFNQLLAAVTRASVVGHNLFLKLPDGGVLHMQAVPAEAPRPP